jgi:hypothetical protein
LYQIEDKACHFVAPICTSTCLRGPHELAWVIVPTLLRHRPKPARRALLGFIAIFVTLAAVPPHALVTAGSGGADR